MESAQENKLSMYETVEELLDAKNALISTLPGLVIARAALVNRTLQIRQLNIVQLKSTTGKTKDKAARKGLLADTSYSMAAAVQAYAAETENNDLYDLVNFTRTTLRETEDEGLAQVCQLIHDQASAVVANLGDYGVTAVELVNLQGLITAWGTQSQAPRMAIAERKVATQTLPLLYKQADLILKKRMDKLMERFRVSNRDFYDTYHTARKIVDAGHGPKKLAKLGGIVFANPLGLPLAGATVQVGELVVTTGADGKFVLVKVPFGERTLIINAPEFMELMDTRTVDGNKDGLVFHLDPVAPTPPVPPTP
jgi:hypothetical protein